MIDLMVEQEGHFPWIRFVSNPIGALSRFRGTRGKGNDELICLPAPSERSSIELAVDFVRPGTPARPETGGFEIHIEWQNRVLRLSAHDRQPGRSSTLSWNHES
jgi:hypothetical protein